MNKVSPFGVVMIAGVFYPSIGGAQTHTLRLSQKLKARGVDVMVVTRHHPGLARYEEVGGIPTYRVGNESSSKAMAALSFIAGALRVLYAQRQRYHVLHCHQMISPMTIGLLARQITNAALVVNPHRSGPIGDMGILTLRRPITGRLRIAAVRRWCDAFVCISPAIRSELAEAGMRPEQLWDIVNGVDLNYFKPVEADERTGLRQSLNLPNGPLVVFTGRLVREKGVDVLINAWPQVQQQVPDAHLILVGEGDKRVELEAQVQKHALNANVHFLGGCDDVTPYLQTADAFVLPSYAEGLPVALLEAMACGLPCVATAVGGTTQLIKDGVTGRSVGAGDAAALASGIVEALTTPAAHKWGVQARQLIAEGYSLDAVAEKYITMYEAIIGPHKRDVLEQDQARQA